MNAISLPPHTLSIVVPFYNEEDNIGPLVKRVHEALADYTQPWELVLVDDGSSDATAERALQAAKEYGPHVRLVELTRNYKQTAAMQAGIDAARGDVIVTMDGDLQNDPIDIPRMVARLLNEDLDLVADFEGVFVPGDFLAVDMDGTEFEDLLDLGFFFLCVVITFHHIIYQFYVSFFFLTFIISCTCFACFFIYFSSQHM